ncbi:MAG: SRPBCC domain-containing protein [Mycobacteriales bacterium]
MTAIDIARDPDTRTLTVTTTFDAPPERVWEIWSDPRQLERWWGPPTYPATVVDHDLAPGGRVTYFMTSPEGDKHHGWWLVQSVEPPRSLEFQDGFADDSGAPNPDLPVTQTHVTLEPDGAGTRMVLATTYATLADLEQVEAMGMIEGISAALDQIPDILAA